MQDIIRKSHIIKTGNIPEKKEHKIIEYQINSKSRIYQEALHKANVLADNVNIHDTGNRERSREEILAKSFGAYLSELSTINYFNNVFRFIFNRYDIRAHEVDFNKENDEDQIDIGITCKAITKTIEVRSSYPFKKNDYEIYNHDFSLIGNYTSLNKPREVVKDYYITVFFRFKDRLMKNKMVTKEPITLFLVAGASKEYLDKYGEVSNLKQDGASYRVIKPIVRAWTVAETIEAIMKQFDNCY